jgi:hypothetical protein
MLLNKQEIKSDNIDNWTQVIAMKRTSTTTFTFKDLAIVKYTILANRAIPFSAMAIVEITPLKDIDLEAYNFMVVPEELKDAKSQFRVLRIMNI